MTKYLISFPSRAMELADDEWELVGRESHAVVQQAKDAGVWVFGGGIEESVAPVRVAGDGTVTEGAYPENERLSGGFAVLELPVARRCTGVGGTLRRLLPVPARGLGVHVRPGVLSRPVARHRSPPTRECQRTTRASLRRRTSAPTIAPSPTTTVMPPRPTSRCARWSISPNPVAQRQSPGTWDREGALHERAPALSCRGPARARAAEVRRRRRLAPFEAEGGRRSRR